MGTHDKHLMIDLETMDTEETACILTIGAVIFDPRGEDSEDTMNAKLMKGEGFSIRCSLESNMLLNRTVSAGTVLWWLTQSEEARNSLVNGKQVPLGLALSDFRRWIASQETKITRVWAKDPDFDVKIMQNAMKMTNEMWPFHFSDSRSVRTVIDLAYPEGDCPSIGKGTAHDAFDDSVRQALTIQHCHHTLNC